jgi:hypothetical protein
MLVFAAQMADCKRTGMREFGELAQRYATEFDRKWLRGGAPAGETLLGSPDIQSLADLGTSYEVVREMRVTPFTLRTALELAIATAVPLLPLTLTIFSAQELLATLLKVIF